MTDSVYDAFQLNAVIDRLTPEKLVSITKSICRKFPAARELFSDFLFVSESEVSNSGAARTGASSTDNNESERDYIFRKDCQSQKGLEQNMISA